MTEQYKYSDHVLVEKVCILSKKISPNDMLFKCRYCGGLYNERKTKKGLSCRSDDSRKKQNREPRCKTYNADEVRERLIKLKPIKGE